MKKIAFQFAFLSLLIGLKILLCSYHCPAGSTCKHPVVSPTTCPFEISCQNATTGSPITLPHSNYEVDFSQPQTDAGWVYTFNIQSDVYCTNITVGNGQNIDLVIATNYIKLPMVPGEQFSVFVTIESPCIGSDQVEFSGKVDPVQGVISCGAFFSIVGPVSIDMWTNPGC